MADTASCRILILSSSLDKGQQFVQRVRALADTRNGVVDGNATTKTSDASSTTIPWTITNKYYTADVHFEMREVHTFTGDHASEVPAVIYVWDRGEPHQDHLPTLAQKLEQHDPEVLLAVRFKDESKPVAHPDDEDNLDEFASSHGFEYIDGERGGRMPTQDGGGVSDEDDADVPGLPRVIDALSTIMWPSLVQSASTTTRKSRARELLDWAREEEADDGLRALMSPGSHQGGDDLPTTGSDEKKSRMQREMEELERWLEEEDVGRRQMDDAWRARDDEGGWADVPTPTIRSPGEPSFGFEDDFAEFVGAPMDVAYGHEAARQVPMHTGASYRSLASADDLFNEGDADLPSRSEIEEASKRIFGAASLDVPTTSRARTRSPAARTGPLPVPPSPEASPATRSDSGFDALEDDSFASFGDQEDDDFELGAFDLSRVLSALQGMKEEIAGMTDEDERRKAAARVALGLVYGLRKEDERERGPEEL